MLSGKKQADDQRYKYYVLRLGSRESESYTRTISRQKVWLPKIPGWSTKQRYFRLKVDDAVLSTQLKNDHLHEQLLEELDKNCLPSPKEGDLFNDPTSRRTLQGKISIRKQDGEPLPRLRPTRG